jgi:hypothetical protein
MKVELSESDWAFAKSVYDEFSKKPGAQHIASEFALAHLSAVVNKVKPRSVLEFGAGIGTITYFLMKHPVNISHVTTTESNDFCLEQFAANIPDEFSGRYDLVVDDSTLAPGQRHYDLVIVDVSVSSQGYAYLDSGMTCFVEGARSTNRREIEAELAGRGLRCDFVNYNRGTQYCSIVLRRSKKSGIPYPKFRFRKVRKGCWIGAVEPAL